MTFAPDIPGPGGARVPDAGVATLKTARGTAAAVLLDGMSWPVKGSQSWGYTSGTQPQTAIIPMLKPYANKLAETLVEDVTLTLTGRTEDDEALSENYQKLWCILRPPVDYNHAAIIITDDRWWWKKELVYRHYNLKRKSDDQHVFARTTSAGKVGLQQARSYFVPWSIIQDAQGNPVRPWTALDIVLDVLQNWLGYAPEEIDVSRAATSEFTPMNQSIVGKPADEVIQRYLNLSDNSLYIENDGTIAIYGNRAPAGIEELKRWFPAGIPSLRSGAFEVINQTASRPTYIEGTMEREFELLCRYREIDSRVTYAISEKQQVDNALISQFTDLENVTTTLVPNQVPGLPRGSIVHWEDALAAFGNRFGSGPITLSQWRELYGPSGIAGLINALRTPNGSELDPLALIIFSRLFADYRTFFRMPQAVADRLKDINPVLVDVIIPSSGLRAPSEVYSIVSMQVNFMARLNDMRKRGLVMNSFRNVDGSVRAAYQPISAKVSVVDKDLGLFRVDFLDDVDKPGLVEDILPGEALLQGYYDDKFSRNQTVLGRDAMPGLKGDWECSFIVSAVALTPNNGERVQRLRVERPESQTEGYGPRVIFHNELETARFALPASLGKYRNPARNIRAADGWVNRSICEAVIEQDGQRRWLTFADQVGGGVEMGWTETTLNLRPFSSVQQISHTIGSNGRATVSTQATPLSDGPRLENLLPASVLEMVYRQHRHKEPPQGGRA